MRCLLILLFQFVFLVKNYSQHQTFRVPDYDSIKKEISDSASIYYYPKLLSRLIKLDTTLTNEDFRHLYYGYIFQPEYQPYWRSPYENQLVRYYRNEKIEEKDYDEIIQLSFESINEFPFDLRQLNFLAYVYHMKGDDSTARKLSFRFDGTLEAILSSGDGKTCETGFHVISVAHEYIIVNYFGFHVKSQTLSGTCDVLGLEPDERNIESLYFNIEKLMEVNK
jgi:hypothetical protein